MIRATAATWLNYATTIVFQILFAAQFGSSGVAGAFVIAFAIAVSIGGVFVTTSLTNVLPRLLGEGGAISRPALRVLAVIGLLVLGSAAAIWVTSGVLAGLIAPPIGVSTELMTTLLTIAAVFLATLGLAGVLGSVALIRGHRFLPALAPALPSTAGAIYLLAAAEAGVAEAFAAIAVGGVIQVLLMAVIAVFPPFRRDEGAPLRLGRIATLTAVMLLLMGLLPPLQRFLAAAIEPAGAAQFDYAARGVQVALQLLLGGLVIAALPDWTRRYGEHGAIHSEVSRTIAVAALVLFAAAGVALVAATPIVRLVYERGAFVGADTESVAAISRVLVPGFVAEGLWLVIAQALLATGRTDLVLRVWAVRFVAQLVLTALLGIAWGAIGVAAAYSLSNLLATGVAALFSAGAGIFREGRPLVSKSFQAGAVTAAAAVVLFLAGTWIPPVIGAGIVLGIALLVAYLFGLLPVVVATLRGLPPVATEADA